MAVLEQSRRRSGRRFLALALALSTLAVVTFVPTVAAASGSSADLSVTVEHSPGAPVALDEVTITLRVRNDGPDTAIGAVAAFGEVRYQFELVEVPDGCSSGGESGSLICPLGDLVANTTTEVVITVRPRASGLYPLIAAVASSTPDPDSEDRTASDSIIVQRGVSQAERYLGAIYPIILDRPLDPASLAFWGPRWQRANLGYPQNREQVPAGILRSNEHRRQTVRAGFTQILGRSVDPAGLTYWVTKLGTGFTTEQFERTLLISSEFVRKHPGSAYLPAIVAAVVGSAPTGSQLAEWQRRIAGLTDRRAIATKVQRSTEAYDVLIANAHQRAFGTAPLPLERYNWQVGLRNGETRESMLADLLVSWKFLRDFPLSEDDYPFYEEFARTPPDPAAVLAEAETQAAL